jgi:hypothetical protein
VEAPRESFPPDLTAGANKLLARDATAERFLDDNAGEQVVLRRVSRVQHVEALARVYAIHVAAGADERWQRFIVEATRHRGSGKGRREKPLNRLLRALIDYGEDGRNLRSRDANAIAHLLKRGVAPDRVLDLFAQHGQGLDLWARSAARKLDDAETGPVGPRPVSKKQITSAAPTRATRTDLECVDGDDDDDDEGRPRSPAIPAGPVLPPEKQISRQNEFVILWSGEIQMKFDVDEVDCEQMQEELATFRIRVKRNCRTSFRDHSGSLEPGSKPPELVRELREASIRATAPVQTPPIRTSVRPRRTTKREW